MKIPKKIPNNSSGIFRSLQLSWCYGQKSCFCFFNQKKITFLACKLTLRPLFLLRKQPVDVLSHINFVCEEKILEAFFSRRLQITNYISRHNLYAGRGVVGRERVRATLPIPSLGAQRRTNCQWIWRNFPQRVRCFSLLSLQLWSFHAYEFPIQSLSLFNGKLNLFLCLFVWLFVLMSEPNIWLYSGGYN